MQKSSLVLIVLLILAPGLGAQTLQVVTEDWRPYNYLDGAEVRGLSTDVVKQVLDRAGLAYTITVMPWSRAYSIALTQPNVLIYTLIRIEPREKLFQWVRPLGKGGVTSLYRLKDRPEVQPRTPEEAKAFTVIANKDSMDDQWLNSRGFSKRERPPLVADAIRMLFARRGDLIAFDSAVIRDEFKNLGLNPDAAVKVLDLFQTPPYMAVSLATSDALVKKLQKAQDELLAEGKIRLVN